MFEKYILYIFIRYIEMYVYFGFTVSLKAYGEVIIFKILFCAIKIILRHTHHPEHFSAFDAHNPEHFSVAHNAEKWLPLLPTTTDYFSALYAATREKSALISVFSVLLPTTANHFSVLWATVQKNVQLCSPPWGKIISVVGNNEKNVWIRISPRIRTIGEFILEFQSEARLMCFVKKSWHDKFRGTIPLRRDTILPRGSIYI